jgi:hypothetical protein
MTVIPILSAASNGAGEEAYLRDLSDLGRRHGVGLTGQTQLYQLEPEDMAFDYSADAEGFVGLGLTRNADCDAKAKAGQVGGQALDAADQVRLQSAQNSVASAKTRSAD